MHTQLNCTLFTHQDDSAKKLPSNMASNGLSANDGNGYASFTSSNETEDKTTYEPHTENDHEGGSLGK